MSTNGRKTRGRTAAIQAEALARDAREDTKQGHLAQTKTASALPVPRIEELSSTTDRRISPTLETDENLQQKVVAETARLDLQILLKDKS